MFIRGSRAVRAAEDGGAGGGGPDVAALQQELAALKAQNGELKGKVDEFRTNNIDMKKRIDALGDLTADDVTQLKELQKLAGNSEKLKLLKDGKLEEYDRKILEPVQKKYERDIEALTGQVKSLTEATDKWRGRWQGDRLDSLVKTAASAAGVRGEAIEDVTLYARQAFKVDEDGNLISAADERNAQGKPLTVDDWLGGMKEKKAYWFPGKGGGDGTGGAGGGNTTKAVKDMSEKEKSDFVAKHGIAEWRKKVAGG